MFLACGDRSRIISRQAPPPKASQRSAQAIFVLPAAGCGVFRTLRLATNLLKSRPLADGLPVTATGSVDGVTTGGPI